MLTSLAESVAGTRTMGLTIFLSHDVGIALATLNSDGFTSRLYGNVIVLSTVDFYDVSAAKNANRIPTYISGQSNLIITVPLFVNNSAGILIIFGANVSVSITITGMIKRITNLDSDGVACDEHKITSFLNL
jgi:hypothetical protein